MLEKMVYWERIYESKSNFIRNLKNIYFQLWFRFMLTPASNENIYFLANWKISQLAIPDFVFVTILSNVHILKTYQSFLKNDQIFENTRYLIEFMKL